MSQYFAPSCHKDITSSDLTWTCTFHLGLMGSPNLLRNPAQEQVSQSCSNVLPNFNHLVPIEWFLMTQKAISRRHSGIPPIALNCAALVYQISVKLQLLKHNHAALLPFRRPSRKHRSFWILHQCFPAVRSSLEYTMPWFQTAFVASQQLRYRTETSLRCKWGSWKSKFLVGLVFVRTCSY